MAVKQTKKQKQEIAKAVNDYYRSSQENKRREKQWDEYKKSFYSYMDGILPDDDEMAVDMESVEADLELVVTKVQKTTVKWNPEKVAKVEGAEDAIRTKVEIVNWPAFVKYLKSIGGSAKKVKEFLSVTKMVDTKCLEKLEALGVVTKDDLDGCYSATVAAPYYLVKERQK